MNFTWTDRGMAVFLGGMSLLALAFWGLALGNAGGTRAIFEMVGPSATALFVVAHMPAMAAAILLWRRIRSQLAPLPRALLGASMVYFSAACIIAFGGNYLLASLVNGFTPSADPYTPSF